MLLNLLNKIPDHRRGAPWG